MAAETDSQTKYTYSFKVRAEDETSTGVTWTSRDEIQQFVNASLGMLTGGCGVCEFAHHNNSPALFCERKKSPVNWSAPRCEFFIRGSTQAKDALA